MPNTISYPFVPLGILTVTTAGTPKQISSTSIKTLGFYATAIKAKGTANTGSNVYIEDGSGNVLFVIPKAQVAPILISPRLLGLAELIDLSQLWIDCDSAASGDGLLVTYQV